MLKENINFIVKGYDILKTIQNKLVEIKSLGLCNSTCINYNKENNISNHKDINYNKNNLDSIEINQNLQNNLFFKPNSVYAKIFSNMNFSFAIEFSIGNFM